MRVGFLRAAWLVALKDLRLEWRTWETTSSTFVFALTSLVVFQFAFAGTARELGSARIVPGVIWTVVVFAAVVALVRSLQLERTHGTLGALFLCPIERGAIYAGKCLANLVKLSLLQALLLPLAAIFFGQGRLPDLGPLASVCLVHGIGLTALGTLFAAVTTRLGRGEALLAVLLFPAASPLVISAVECTTAVLDGSGLGAVLRWMLLAAGLDLLYLLVGLATFELVLEE
jgi:heme exporter protein B